MLIMKNTKNKEKRKKTIVIRIIGFYIIKKNCKKRYKTKKLITIKNTKKWNNLFKDSSILIMKHFKKCNDQKQTKTNQLLSSSNFRLTSLMTGTQTLFPNKSKASLSFIKSKVYHSGKPNSFKPSFTVSFLIPL